jgi:metallo-beta-lactamase family protein
MQIVHHGAHQGVTGSCHQLLLTPERSLLIDCGLFQGSDAKRRHEQELAEIDFRLDGIQALILTHVHLDHIGRIPYLMAEGFRGPIYCTAPTAKLLPLMLEDSMRLNMTRNQRLIDRFLVDLRAHIRPLSYGKWHGLDGGVELRFSPAGHVLGSAYVEIEFRGERFIFSGDLGAPYEPLLKETRSPERADMLVLESTYGDRLHSGREHRRQILENILCKSFHNSGVTIIPAFSLGRTQELLFELNDIFNRVEANAGCPLLRDVDVIIDSPLSLKVTEVYDAMREHWSEEALNVLTFDEEPFDFGNLMHVRSHEQHEAVLHQLKASQRPAVVIAGSGMCTGGRVVNYLKHFVSNPTTDVVFVGFQAHGTPGRYIQDRSGWVKLDGERFDIQAAVHTLSGYSAHADQADLIRFVQGMEQPPQAIRLVHGEPPAKQALSQKLTELGYNVV